MRKIRIEFTTSGMGIDMSNNNTMEYHKAIDFIFQMIKDGKLIIGSKIPSERYIAETLGIGRNSTREAISILRGMGLIESIHGSGNYIAKDSGHTIWQIVSVMLALGSISMKDILEFRRVMAGTVVEFVFRHGLSNEEKDHLEEILAEMETAYHFNSSYEKSTFFNGHGSDFRGLSTVCFKGNRRIGQRNNDEILFDS